MNNQTIEATLVKANKLKREGQVTEAVSFYRQAINTNPHFHWYYYYLGEALSTIGNLDEAITSFSNAIQLKPDIAWFHLTSWYYLKVLTCFFCLAIRQNCNRQNVYGL